MPGAIYCQPILAVKLIGYYWQKLRCMKKIVPVCLIVFFAAACNNSANDTSSADSTAKQDNTTNIYDTGVGSSMADTSRRLDTSNLTQKMQDTGAKK